MKKKFIAVSVLICALALGSTDTYFLVLTTTNQHQLPLSVMQKANQLNALAKLRRENKPNAVKIAS